MVEFKQSTLDSLSRSEQDDRDQLPSLVNPQARKPASIPGADIRFKAQTLESLTRSEPSPLPNVLNDALTRNPDKFSQDKKVGKAFNLPPSAAENDDGTLALNARSLELQRALAESPYTKQWFSTPDNAKLAHDDVDSLTGIERAASSVYNYGANLASGVGESFFNRIVGGSTRFVGTLTDDLADYLETNVIDLGRIEYDFTGEGPLLRWRPSTEEDIAQDSPLLKYAEDFEAVDLGYKAAVTWDDFLENPAVNFIPFALETGLVSLPDMVATLRNLPAYVAARSGDIGQARAENDGRVTATTGDLFNAMPYAVSAALLERIGAKGVFGLGTDALRGRGALAVAGATGRAALKESITEGVQEPLEYAGETVGTAAGFQFDEAAQRALQGFVVGSGFGGSIRAGTATLESRAKSNAARRRAGMMQELNNQESKLRDRDPAVWAEFQAGLMEENGVEAVIISEEGVGILQQAIEALPADQRPVINTDGFSSLGATVSPKDFWSLPKDTIDALAEHVAFDVNQPSAAEAEEIANLTETLSQDDFIAEVEETISTLDERDTLTADIEQQIMETGGALSADPANARAAARQMSAAFTTLARRSGMTVEQVRARFPVRVERVMGDMRPAGTLEQVSPTAARFTGERIDRILSDYSYTGVDLKKSKGYVAFINPQQFVEATTDARYTAEQVAEDAGLLDAERLAAEDQTPYVRIDTDGTIVSHEGRHRMSALARAGVTEVPVIVQEPAGDYYEAQPSRTLRGQFDPATRLDLRDVTPLSEENRQAVLDEFGGGDAGVLFQDGVDDATARLEDRGPVRAPRGKTYMGVVEAYTVENTNEDAPKYKKNAGLIQASTNQGNAASQSAALDALFEKHPNPLSSEQAWVDLANDAFSLNRVPMPPWRTIELVNQGAEAVAAEIAGLSEGMKRDAEEGLKTAREFGELYASGEATPDITAKAFLWSFLSRGVSPYVQEGAFLDAIGSPKLTDLMQRAARDGWSPELEKAYEEWSAEAIPPGSPGRGTQHNLNAFGRQFLRTMTQIPPGSNQTGLEIIHGMIADGTPSKDIRREFLRVGAGAGIDNKVVSFTLLLLGRTDVLVLDRVQVRNQFNDGRFDGQNIYDTEIDENGKQVTGTAFAEMTFGHKGLLYYEAMEAALEPLVEAAYKSLGMEGSLGRYHWDSWLLASNQEVGHASVEGLLRDAQGKAAPYAGAFVRQGKYNNYDYGFRYGTVSDGTPVTLVEKLDGSGKAVIVPHAVMADSKSDLRKTLNKLKKKAKSRGDEYGVTLPWTAALTEEERAEYDGAIEGAGTAAPDVWKYDANAVGREDTTGRPEEGEAEGAGFEQRTGTLFQEVDFVGDVIFEVAPDPNNVELSSRWNALPPEVKLSISDAVSKSVLPSVLEAAAADGSVSSQIGSYLDDTNPSFSLRLTSGDPAAVARAVGFVLSQDSMVALSADAFDGSFEAGAIRIQIGEKSLQEIDAIYQTLRGIDGFPQIGGQSTVDGQMTLILEEGVDPDSFAAAVDSALSSEYDVEVGTVQAAFPEKKDYDYASETTDPAGSEGVARQRYRAVRDQASREVAAAIDRYEQGGQQPALAQQREGVSARGSIDLRNAQDIVVRLYDAENLSTFLHESGHLYLEMLGSLAQDADAPQQIKDDFATVLDWLGVQSREQIGTEQHERWAETYEQYLREGTAPSEDLRSAFAKFTAWLGTIYRQIKQAAQLPRAALTPEITGVMDRILATDEEIAVVRDEMRMAPLFKDAEVAGMSEEQYAEYRQRHEDAREAQRDELTRAAFAEIRREKTKWWREALAKETKRILNVLDQDPVWRARSIIQRGTLPSGAPAPEVYPERLKLSKAATAEYGYTLPGGNQMFARDGVTPERAAQDLGYPSADQMLRELSELPKSEDGKFLTAQQYAERQAKEFLEQEHGNLMDPDEMHEEALLKVHSRRQAEVILDELRTLNRISGRTDRVSNAAAREAARRTIEAQTVSKIQSPTKYLNAERRFAMKAAEAVIAGDLDAARRYKTQQLLNFHMYRHARDARQKADTMIARLAKYNRQKMDPKNIHPEFIRQVKELVSDINFSGRISAARQSRLSAETLQAWADQQSEKFGASFHISPELDRALTKKNIRDFTYTELVGLHDTAKSIVTQGRRYSDAESAQFQQLVRNLGDSVDANAKKQVPARFRKTQLYKAKQFVRLAFAEHRSILNLSEELDGYELGGPVYTEVFQRLKRADDAYIDRSMQAAKAVNKILKAYTRREKVGLFDKKYIPEIGESWSLNERLAFGLNLGNAGNVEALKETFSDTQIDAIVATLSDKDWDVIENIWAYIDSFWPDLSALEERTTGVKPAKVEPSPFTLPSGRQIKGGYYPLVADPDMSANVKGYEDYLASQSLKAFSAGGKAKVSTKHGSTIERKGFGDKRVWLDLRVAFEHIDGVVRDIEMREAVADVSRIIRSEPFAKAVTRAKGGEFYQMFNAWLENTVGASRPPVTTVEKMSQYFRTGASIAEMGASLRTILMQPFGFTQSVALIGEKYAARGLIKYAGQRGKAAREVMEASAFMRNRSATFNRDVREASRWLGVSSLKNDLVTLSFTGIQLLDMAVCVPTWLGAYDKALDEGMVHEDAVDYADNIVAKSQGSGLPRNMADIQQGAVWKRMFTMFYSYFGAYYNVQADQWKQTSFKNPKQALKYAKNQIYLTIIPSIVIDALFNDLFGSDDEEEILRRVGGSVLRQLTGGVVFVRDAVNALTTGFDYQTTPAGNPIKEAANFAKQLGQGEADLPLIKSFIMFSGYMLHIPGARAGTRAASVIFDENDTFEVDEFESWWRLLVAGPKRRD